MDPIQVDAHAYYATRDIAQRMKALDAGKLKQLYDLLYGGTYDMLIRAKDAEEEKKIKIALQLYEAEGIQKAAQLLQQMKNDGIISLVYGEKTRIDPSFFECTEDSPPNRLPDRSHPEREENL